jgi:16S rRNA (guanine1516-N2)-methyltransferase
MSLEVYLAKDLPQKMHDSLQQIIWEFPVKYLSPESLNPADLPTGSLFVDEKGAQLVALSGQKAILFSWLKLQAHWRGEASKVKASPLLRALGARSDEWVVDATCGTGRDTSYLLHHGLNVCAFERNKAIFFLLKSSQVFEDFLHERLNLFFGQASASLDTSDFHKNVPVYFDPMFDDGQGRKAKTKKNMEVFHQVVGADKDALGEAMKLKELSDRLVIKRSPRDGELLPKPSSTWKTKSVRFDLYL